MVLDEKPQSHTDDGTIYGGVESAHPQVYLVFYGSQWGSAGRDVSGNVTLTGDRSGAAPVLQRFFKGLGTNGELYSGVLTQYCEAIDYGLQSCPAGGRHEVYPTGGVLSGVWSVFVMSRRTGLLRRLPRPFLALVHFRTVVR